MGNTIPLNIGFSGSLGQMSQSIINLALKDESFNITALYEPQKKLSENDFIITKYGKLSHSSDINVLEKTDIILDFSHDINTYNTLLLAKKFKKKAVIGTTKLSQKTRDLMDEVSKITAIFYSPNMSYGINAFFSLIPYFLEKFRDFDIEIIETHHRRKKDAPSGTALKIFDIIKKNKEEIIPVFDRSKLDRSRENKEIGISSIRGGGVYGNHSILFLGENEEIEFTHRMLNKDSLAKGALIATKYISCKNKGLFYYENLLEEKFNS